MPNGGILSIEAHNILAQHMDRPADLAAGEFVAIIVHDTGLGMSPDVLVRAAEPFFTTKENGRGTGLGLPMVQRFTTQVGGALRLESQPGQGTAVTLYVPRAPVLVSDDDDQVRSVLDSRWNGRAAC